MRTNILCVMERRGGETGYEDQGFQHFFEFPAMRHIKKVENYYDAAWDYPGNDSGESAYLGGNIYQVNCYGRRILRYHNYLDMNFMDVVVKTPSPFTDDTFRPTGIAFKDGYWYIITAYYSSSVLYNYLNKFSHDWQYISQVALDGSTYEEHDGLGILPNGHFVSGTGYGYLVEYDESGNYFHSRQIDSSNPVRGGAVQGSYVVVSQQDGSKVYVCDWHTLEILETYDLASFLNDSGNWYYGTFFIENNINL